MTQPMNVTYDQAHLWLAGTDAPTVVDVRTPAEFAGDHVPGAVNIPLDLVERHAQRIADAARGDVLLVCRTDNRAGQAARLLAPTLGSRAHVLLGGMTEWSRRGGDTVAGEGGPWAMDRQVRFAAGALTLTGIVASTVVPRAKWLAGGIGAGLVFSGVSDTCAMSSVLAKLPWNRTQLAPTLEDGLRSLAGASTGA